MELRLEAVMEGVLVSGSAQTGLVGECVRCLERVEREHSVDFQELFVYPDSDAEADEAYRLEGDLLDLEPVVRDAVVLAFPFQPVCPGLCPQCGVRLADDPTHAHEAEVDPRWAALAQLRTEDLKPNDAGNAGPMEE